MEILAWIVVIATSQQMPRCSAGASYVSTIFIVFTSYLVEIPKLHVIMFYRKEVIMKNIVLAVDESYHNEVKSFVAKKGMTIKNFIMDLINKEMQKEKEQTQ